MPEFEYLLDRIGLDQSEVLRARELQGYGEMWNTCIDDWKKSDKSAFSIIPIWPKKEDFLEEIKKVDPNWGKTHNKLIDYVKFWKLVGTSEDLKNQYCMKNLDDLPEDQQIIASVSKLGGNKKFDEIHACILKNDQAEAFACIPVLEEDECSRKKEYFSNIENLKNPTSEFHLNQKCETVMPPVQCYLKQNI